MQYFKFSCDFKNLHTHRTLDVELDDLEHVIYNC